MASVARKKFTRLTLRWKLTAYYIYIWAQAEWFKDGFWPEGLLIYRKCRRAPHRVWVPTAGGGSFTGVSGRWGWSCPVPGTADSSNPPWGTPEALSHTGGTWGKVYLRNRKPERRREPTGETAEGTPKSEKEEQPHGKADFPHTDSTQRKDVRGKKQKKETARPTMKSPPSHLLCHSLPLWAWLTSQGREGTGMRE